ncbi:MAG: hypothetical protein HQK76_15355 [Desulfobacterales bacterium]|nr:hypothetical protein [Desulfobacterales bacterium]
MKKLFQDILNIENVQGVIFFSIEGNVIFSHFLSDEPENIDDNECTLFIEKLEGIREAEFVFENKRLYIRKTATGYILVALTRFATIAMVRLNCDILIPTLDKMNKPKGWGRFFKKSK